MTMPESWTHEVVALATGVLVGWVPFAFTWRWRRADQARRAACGNVAAIVAECLSNHELTMQGGRFSSVVIVNNTLKLRAALASAEPRLPPSDSTRLRRLIDQYTDCQQYQELPGKALELARKILSFCG